MPYVSGQTVHDADAHIMELPGSIATASTPSCAPRPRKG